MVNKLKTKFVLISTLSVVIMLILIVSTLSVFNFISMDRKTNDLIDFISYNNADMPQNDKFSQPPPTHYEVPREAPYDTRFFVTYYNEENAVVSTNLANIFSVSPDKAIEYSEKILQYGKLTGYVDNFKYKLAKIKDRDVIIFLDATKEIEILKSFLSNSLFISLIAVFLTVVISYFLSAKAIKPIVLAYEKQKQFITNASHELKTPLTVISANMDILEMNFGENKWIENSTQQVARLNGLVNNLTTLAKLEEFNNLKKEKFCLSEVAKMSVESFYNVSQKFGKIFEYNIQEDLYYYGDEKNIGQLLYIILDNCVKYSTDNGYISFDIRKNQNNIMILLSNTVSDIEIGNYSEFFERFYKRDLSRTVQKNSFGIGLCLAKEIVEAHKGKISAYSKDGKMITIEIVL